jgi:RNA polymerase sigma factor (sigma-70 family)
MGMRESYEDILGTRCDSLDERMDRAEQRAETELEELIDPSLIIDPWESVNNQIAYEQMLEKMTERKRDIVRMYIEQDLTIREIAVELGMAKSTVGEIIKAQLDIIRNELCS